MAAQSQWKWGAVSTEVKHTAQWAVSLILNASKQAGQRSKNVTTEHCLLQPWAWGWRVTFLSIRKEVNYLNRFTVGGKHNRKLNITFSSRRQGFVELGLTGDHIHYTKPWFPFIKLFTKMFNDWSLVNFFFFWYTHNCLCEAHTKSLTQVSRY